ncbi:MAG: flagellar hook-length control protein FliK [Sulfurimonadaceae bacterium]|nr:flagellar hook-length control protein FliK [Sulfurimonadaceae bacterium]
MIQFSTDKQLQILLSNNNRALAEAIKQATPEQLEMMRENKDVKGLLTSLAQESIQSGKSDKVLMEILKNSPVFKTMGDFSADLKSLLTTLKSEPAPSPLVTKLEAFFKTVEKLDTPVLKQQFANSGVFLESKISADANPKAAVKQLLTELLPLLKQSTLPEARGAHKHIAVILADSRLESAKTDKGALQRIAESIVKIVKPLRQAIAKADVIHSKEVAHLLGKLESFTRAEVQKPAMAMQTPDTAKTQAQAITNQPAAPQQASQGNIQSPALQSDPQKQNLTQQPNTSATPQQASAEKPVIAKAQLLQFEWVVQELKNPAIQENVKQELNNRPELFVVKTLLNSLTALHEGLLPSTQSGSKGILQLIEQIVGAIRTRIDAPLELLSDTKLTRQVGDVVEKLQQLIQKGDVIQTNKDIPQLLNKLALYAKPDLLLPGRASEYLNNDAKALLLQLQHEVQSSNAPSANDTLRQIDKLMVQIDYHQLVSYLSNSSAIYFPFSWEGLEQGSLAFKKANDECFYCQINLRLQAFGELNLMLALHNKNEIEIQAYTETDELKEVLKNNLQNLRAAMSEAGLSPRSIRIAKRDENNSATHAYGANSSDLDMGFEVKI